jgi:multimeric flavodoxin WrbA
MKIVALYGSPRRSGNTALLLREAVRGAREEGAEVEEVVLRDLKMSPCLEIYGCKNSGRCAIQDDFQKVYESILASRAVMLASPIFFYTVSAHTKILMDRCQSLWVKKHWLKEASASQGPSGRKGLFISVGATRGKKLFDGALLTVRYYFEAIDCELWRSLLYREMDSEGDVLKRPECLEEAWRTGIEMVRAVRGAEAPAALPGRTV